MLMRAVLYFVVMTAVQGFYWYMWYVYCCICELDAGWNEILEG
jgi:hypothetical protein